MSKLPVVSSSDLVRVVKKFGFVEQGRKEVIYTLKENPITEELLYQFIKEGTFQKEL